MVKKQIEPEKTVQIVIRINQSVEVGVKLGMKYNLLRVLKSVV